MFKTKKVRRQASISLTPLIDVVFILLLFFMLTSSFMHMRQIDVSAATKSDHQELAQDPIVVKLLDDKGDIAVADKQLSINNAAAIRQMVIDKPKAVYIIQAEDTLRTQSLINVLDAFKKAGAKSVTLAGIN